MNSKGLDSPISSSAAENVCDSQNWECNEGENERKQDHNLLIIS